MDKRSMRELEQQREQAERAEKHKPLSKDLFAGRKRLYDKIKIPVKTLDLIIYILVGALLLAILLGIGSNR
jgi:hypothetical protein